MIRYASTTAVATATGPPAATSATISAASTEPSPPGVGTRATATVAARYASAMWAGGTGSPRASPTRTSPAAWSTGKASEPPHSASARDGRVCTERASSSAVRRKDNTAVRSRRTSAKTATTATAAAPMASSSGPHAPSGRSGPRRSACGKAINSAASRPTRATLSASRYNASAAEERASGSPHTVMKRRLTALAPSPVGSRWLAEPAANWVTSSRSLGSRSTTAPCRVTAAATQVRQVAPAAASSHGHLADAICPMPSASTDRCRTATTTTRASGSRHSIWRSGRRPRRRPAGSRTAVTFGEVLHTAPTPGCGSGDGGLRTGCG